MSIWFNTYLPMHLCITTFLLLILFVSACDPQKPRRTKSCPSEEYPHGPSDQCIQTELSFKKYSLLIPKY